VGGGKNIVETAKGSEKGVRGGGRKWEKEGENTTTKL